MKKARIIIGILLSAIIISSVSGCANSKTSAGVTTIKVAVPNNMNPYDFLDAKGNYTGFEVVLLQDIDKLLPQYSFKFETVSDQFVALAAGKANLISCQWEKNPERAKTYLFGDEYNTTWANYIVVLDNNKNITSLKSLEGKTVQVVQGGNDAYLIETYNKKHNNAIKVVYGGSDFSLTINKLKTSAIDAFISPPVMVAQFNKAYNVNLKTAGNPISNSDTYFIYRKNDPKEAELKTAVDGALKKLRADGTLKKLSVKWLGADFTTEKKLDGED